MNTRTGWSLVIGLSLLIVALTWVLFATPAPVAAPTITASDVEMDAGTEQTQQESQPLHTRVTVTSPKSGAVVGRSIAVSGSAPGNWFFEGSFPIQVRDVENSKIGQGIAEAQGDWMTTGLVPFIATIAVSNYSGPANLVLLRANPSGLPENDDALEIPIVVQ